MTSAAAAALTITLFARCPLPMHEMIVTVPPDGAVRMTVISGFEGPRRGATIRQKKQLTPKDLKDLARVVRKSDYRSLPDRAPREPERRHLTDVCSRSIEIAEGDEKKSVSYDDNTVTPEIEALADGIYGVLDRHEWVEDKYPWEDKKP